MKFGLLILVILGLISCQSDRPDLSWGKSATIVTDQVFNNETQLILPEPWAVKYETTSKGPVGSKRIYFKNELVMWYRTNIPIKNNRKWFRTINSDTIMDRKPIIIEHATNDTTHFLKIYEFNENEEHSYNFFSGYSNPKLMDVELINRLYEYLLADLSK